MKYKVYQASRNDVEFCRDALCYGRLVKVEILIAGFKAGKFDHVADVTANSLEHAFTLLNLWNDESKVVQYKPTHSLSVGDILIDDQGNAYVTASFGFDKVKL